MSDKFFYTHVSGLDSSALALAAYHEPDNLLFIRFNYGAEYLYYDVPKAVFEGLVDSDSSGSYYNRAIYGKFTSDSMRDTELIGFDIYLPDTEEESAGSAPVSKFAVRWVSEGESAEPLFDATDEADALRQFNEQVERSEAFLGRSLDVKIEAVIHYF